MSRDLPPALLARRPSPGEVAALFSDGSAFPEIDAPRAPRPGLSGFAGRVISQLRLLALSQVPCEDVVLAPTRSPQAERASTQM